ncbi:hypothetical protein MB27_19075 [Actinoplanes utahensis]|uniref:Uncharacterized protein n=2 Tax=Actinoplanes utahensis TaxID=1869 RepID=A0A0A6X780_ACTUT|nr:hypothetical protein MB27_19075 [Actinoplanes utahensis]
MMIAQTDDPIRDVAEQVADSLSHRGYAFVEDDKVEPLAATLRAFLQAAGIPLNVAGEAEPVGSAAI